MGAYGAVGLTPHSPAPKPWYQRWWAITGGAVLALAVFGSFLPDETAPDSTAQTGAQKAEADPAANASTDAEPVAETTPVDTDGDGVEDEVDIAPEDPKLQTVDDVDTDKDGVADHKDDFPKNAEFSTDSDGDGVADPIDAFPKDERYSKDSDGDKVADSEDDFPADPTRSEMSSGMVNAVAQAESYLDYTAFSRTGLIEQLEFEGYSNGDATFAVDHLQVNWSEQAVKSAENYLDFSSFSLTGLIDQLVFEGFTYEQASYGANKAY